MYTAKDAVQQIEDLITLIEEDVPDWAKDKASDFFEDVAEKARDMAVTIGRTNNVTPKQRSAIDGWEAGVRKWIR